jgi:phosphate transport system protein
MTGQQIIFRDLKLEHLRDTLQIMTHSVIIQVQKSKQALFKNDTDLALEVMSNSRRINIFKLKIDYDCKNFLALYNPVAVDLRFILSSMKISESLERISNHTKKICTLFEKNSSDFNADILRAFNIHIMFDGAIQMLYNMQEAMDNENPEQAGEIFKKDLRLNKINREADTLAFHYIVEDPENTKTILSLLEIIHKVERIGDEVKNISERLIFYYEAKVVRHSSFYKGEQED